MQTHPPLTYAPTRYRRLFVERLEDRELLSAATPLTSEQLATAIAAGQARFPAAQVVFVGSDDKDGEALTEVFLRRGSELFELEIAADGTVVETAQIVEVADIPAHVAAVVRGAFPGAVVRETEIILLPAGDVEYELFLHATDGQAFDVTVGSLGQILEVESLSAEEASAPPNSLVASDLGEDRAANAIVSIADRTAAQPLSPVESSQGETPRVTSPPQTGLFGGDRPAVLAEPITKAPDLTSAWEAEDSGPAEPSVALTDAVSEISAVSSRDQFFARLARSLQTAYVPVAAVARLPMPVIDLAALDEQLLALLRELDDLAAVVAEPIGTFRSGTRLMLAAVAGTSFYLLIRQPRGSRVTDWDELANTWAWGLTAKAA